MIDAKELRIGNLIILDTCFALPDVHVIKAKDIYDISEGKITLASISKIPLTEEWLLKFGFEKKDKLFESHYFGLFKHIKLQCSIKEDSIFWWTSQNKYSPTPIQERCFINNVVQYVHQLQNLYYALTGYELTIKELTNQ